MNESFDLLEEITKRYGKIKRARGSFLYTQSGTRITDLWRDGGRALLGWGAGKARMYFKNSIDRSFSGIYENKFPCQLEKALRTLCGDFAFYAFYTDKAKIQKAAECAGLCGSENPPLFLPWLDYGLDLPLLPHAGIRKPAIYCTDDALKNELVSKNKDCVEILLPFSWQPATLLAFKDSSLKSKIPENDGMPAPLCEALCRALYDLRLELPCQSAQDWALYDKELTPYWHRIGPYLKYKGSKDKYKDFFLHCLEQKILVSPSCDSFSIVPSGADKGIFSLLKNRPFAG